MSLLVNKIKKATAIIKQLTLLLKSFKSLCEIIFYIFLMFYIGHDKISSITTQHKIEIDEVNYGVVSDVEKGVIEKMSDSVFYVDPLAIIIILILVVLVGIKINNLINKNK